MADRAIRHSIFLERLKATQVNKIVRLVNATNKDVLNTLERRLANIATRGFDTSPFATQRLRQLAVSTGTLVRSGARNTYGVLKKDLSDIAISEAEFQVKLFKDLVPFDLSYITPSGPLLRSITTTRPFQGKLLKTWFDDFASNTQRNIVSQLNMGMVAGESIPTLVSRLRTSGGVFSKSRNEVARIVRTAVNHTTTQARELTYKENEDVIKGVQWLSTLDKKTSEICMRLDGKVFPVGKGERPPAHLQCRSTTTPIMKSFEELGLPFKDATPGTRASMNGQVPAKITYPQWLKTQPASVQNEVLGLGKAKMFRSGKLKLDKLPPDGRPLSLQQLRVKEGLISQSVSAPNVPSPLPVVDPLKMPKIDLLTAQNEFGTAVGGLSSVSVLGSEAKVLQIAAEHTRWINSAFPKIRDNIPGAVKKFVFAGKAVKGNDVLGTFSYGTKTLTIAQTRGRKLIANNSLGKWEVDRSFSGTYRHELGHGMDRKLKGADWFTDVHGKMSQTQMKSGVSQYAATNERELWAESFSAYTNPTYGLKGKRLPKLIEDYMEKRLGKHPNLAVTPKPIVVPKLPPIKKVLEPTTFGKVIKVPKTPIKKTTITPGKMDKIAPPSEQLGSKVFIKLDAKDQIALFNELEATGVTGPRLEAAKAAIMDSSTRTAVIRRGTGQIEGAISYYTKEGELVISNISSLGRVQGGGAELLRIIIRKAARANQGISFQAAEGAIPWFQKLGFSTSGNVMSLSPSRVKQLRGALGKRGRSIASPTVLKPTVIGVRETKNTGEWLASLSQSERQAFQSYTGSSFSSINKAMASIQPGSEKTRQLITNMKTATTRRPPTRVKQLFRGMGWDANETGIKPWITEGAEIDVKSFFSSSSKKSSTRDFIVDRDQSVVLRIINPKNAVDIQELAFIEGEGEFLFIPQKYKILKVKELRRGHFEVDIVEIGI